MALSAANNIELYIILEVPYFDGTNTGGYNVVDGMGSLSSQYSLSGSTQGVAVTQITAFLAAMDSTTRDTYLSNYLDAHRTLGTSQASIEGGAVEGVSGFRYVPDAERQLIADRVKILVPFYKYHEVLAKKSAIDSANSINVMACR